MDVASLLRSARRRAGLSLRGQAERAGTSPAALVAYDRGRRSPTVGTLERLLDAADVEATVHLRPIAVDAELAAHRLGQVLELADALPRRPAARHLSYPRLPRR